MTTPLTPLVQRFIDTVAPVMVSLDGTSARADQLRLDAAVEAAHIVAGVIDADGLHSDDELWAYIMTFAPLFETALIRATPADARQARLLEGRRQWLTTSSPMFELLINVDKRDGTNHAW